ncbi:MAG: c-type cytochrome [Verrucomicrobiales bacterium]|nr:c-type cytochrome [Verrucomicrobiales bacterium]
MMLPRLFLGLIALVSVQTGTSEDFPTPFNTEPDASAKPMDATEAAKSFQALPPGCGVSVFAAEPDIQNPIALSWDSRGRLWVAENYTYGKKGVRLEMSLRDRVLIFEDTDWDGVADKRTVFTDDVQVLTSIEVGRGGTWLICCPQLLFIPDADGDDIPDGPPEVVLDGFTVAEANYHNFANGLRIGPDGWLYGRCGHSCPGLIGKPGTPDADRIPIKGGIWRYHPDTKIFEVLTHGTVNPWGHDWNKAGELFHINTVTGHLWHGIPGAHFQESYGESKNPYIFSRLSQHADHYHYDRSGKWQDSRDGEANEFGGGHSHIGMCIYQADHFPKDWHGKLLTWNQHGRRINRERLDRHGAGYVGRHEPDRIICGDDWFRGIEISTGPDGALYGLDWSDTGECHDHTGVHRTSGRIYKFAIGKPEKPDLSLLSKYDKSSIEQILNHPNIWHYRRWVAGLSHTSEIAAELHLYIENRSANSPTSRLRAIWALEQLKVPYDPSQWLSDDDEAIRSWAIRLITQHSPIDTINSTVRATKNLPTEAFLKMANYDPSGLVRLTLASTLQRLPGHQRASIASALAAHKEDAGDHNLPHIVWFGLIPLVETDPNALIKIAATTQWPLLRQWIARALGNQPEALENLLTLASEKPDIAVQILDGLDEAFKGLRKVPKPKNWEGVSGKLNYPEKIKALGVLFGDGKALDEVIATALNGELSFATRETALKTLIEAKPANLKEICSKLVGAKDLNQIAVRGLALYEDVEIGSLILKHFKSYRPDDEKAAFVEVLCSRAQWANLLLDEIRKGRISREEISPYQARQILALNDDPLSENLRKVWGDLRQSDGAKKELIEKMKASLTPESLAAADLGRGRMHFQMVCGACHKLYGSGGVIGPDLTGSGRSDLDYLLENIIDPGAIVPADYRMTIIKTKDGRLISGVLKSENDQTVTLALAAAETTVEKSSIDTRTISPASMMPEGLLLALNPEQIRDLIAYLKHPVQVPLPE